MNTLRLRRLERLGFWVWLLIMVTIVLGVVVVTTAATVRHAMLKGARLSPAQSDLVMAIADYPSRAKAAVMEVAGAASGKTYALVLDRKAVETPAWQRIFPSPAFPGYLLLSGVEPQGRQSSVRLIRIADGQEMAHWMPDWGNILSRSADSPFAPGVTRQTVRAIHPLLLPDGDIIFNTNAAMVRQGLCSAKPVWVLGEVLHHSNQRDTQGDIWTPSVGGGGFDDNAFLAARVRDDAIARISPDGRLLERHSFARIMRDNGLQALLLGTQGMQLNTDPIHINEIAIAPNSGKFWQQGDLLVSARHLSTLFLYRPSTGRIVWHQTGPWMNQHAAAFVDDHSISVLNNNIIAAAPLDQPFVRAGDTNQFMVFDFRTGAVTRPFKLLIEAARPVTMTEGRARLLPDGGLFFEESNSGRLLRFTRDGLMWSFVNDVADDRIGGLSWSRYITAENAEPTLHAIAARNCAAGG